MLLQKKIDHNFPTFVHSTHFPRSNQNTPTVSSLWTDEGGKNYNSILSCSRHHSQQSRSTCHWQHYILSVDRPKLAFSTFFLKFYSAD